MKKTLIAILFVTLFIGLIFIPAGASQKNDSQPKSDEKNEWMWAAITGGLLVENVSYDKHYEKLNIFTNIEITGTVLYLDNFPFRGSFLVGNFGRLHWNEGDRLTIKANMLFRTESKTIAEGEEFWFGTAMPSWFKVFRECVGVNVRLKELE